MRWFMAGLLYAWILIYLTTAILGLLWALLLHAVILVGLVAGSHWLLARPGGGEKENPRSTPQD